MARSKKKTNHLLLSAYFRQEVFSPEFAGALQALLARMAPSWSTDLRVAKDEYSKRWVQVRPDGGLQQAILDVAPPKFGVGDAVVSGAYEGLLLILSSSRSTSAPEANRITVEITDSTEIEGRPSPDWLESFTRELVTHLPCRYARAHTAEEFDAKNLVTEGGGVRSVGTNLRKQLPGLYWLNYFGEEFVARVGQERFGASADGAKMESIAGGMFVQLSKEPSSWKTAQYQELTARLITQLGSEHFFVKGSGSA